MDCLFMVCCKRTWVATKCKTRLIMWLHEAKSVLFLFKFSRISWAVLHQIWTLLSNFNNTWSKLFNEVQHDYLWNTLTKNRVIFFITSQQGKQTYCDISIGVLFGYIGNEPFPNIYHSSSLLLLLFPQCGFFFFFGGGFITQKWVKYQWVKNGNIYPNNTTLVL